MKKKMLFAALACMLVFTTACGKKDTKKNTDDKNTPKQGEVANTNDGVIKGTTIDGLSIQNVVVIYDNKTKSSTYSADVVNTTEAPIDVKSFNIIFKDASGNEITQLLGYVGKSLAAKESYTITSAVGLDLSKAKTVEYVRNA